MWGRASGLILPHGTLDVELAVLHTDDEGTPLRRGEEKHAVVFGVLYDHRGVADGHSHAVFLSKQSDNVSVSKVEMSVGRMWCILWVLQLTPQKHAPLVRHH